MRKLITFFLVMSIASCAFTSCGKTDDDGSKHGNSDTGENTVSDGGQSGTDESTDNVNNSRSGDESSGDPVVGVWRFTDNTPDVNFLEIHDRNSASVLVKQDLSEIIFFDEEQNLVFPGGTFSAEEYTFDGRIFDLSVDGNNYLTMEKTDGTDGLFGKYKWLDCTMYSSTAGNASDGDADIYMDCGANSTFLYLMTDVDGFSITDDAVTMDGGVFGSRRLITPVTDASYTIDGDTMTTVNADGEEMTLTRVSRIE